MASKPLLHREAELGLLEESFADLSKGKPGIVVVQGSRGMGKTKFLQAVAARGKAPTLVLRARCHPAEHDFAFGVIRQLFDPLIGSSHLDGVVDQLIGPNQGTAPDLLYGLYRAARSLTEMQSLLIVVDDFTDADAMSAQWLAYIARRLDGLPRRGWCGR
ncbi:AAA family ATPase [Nonomuraea sp. NPDC050536]|uniref:AAA family ATPase n=1 Tax=Nonomuraea sp. NPDC050536 TaxID=3364366 RepID=UPI0037C55B4F